MDDMVRGRINSINGENADIIFQRLRYKQRQYKVIHVEPPRRGPTSKKLSESEFGYPRYHIILQDSKTGLTHEWQIGTKAVTDVFEYKAKPIKFPDKRLYNYFNPDLHDIDYDLFRSLLNNPKYKQLAKEIGIPQFCNKVDRVAGKAGRYGEAVRNKQLFKEIELLHEEAGKILKRLYDEKGFDFIINFAH